ncbi:YgaP family membrane protein [Salinimicrobium flavum]|uniref:DUF2892 domain-containing protein n=1 Tax=Salinimicrobium flavum TaxID=1737065 RepID=A0ABW5J211_9FLAO
MKENVGKQDQLIRSIVGPALIGIGYLALGGNKGKIEGLASIVVGTLLAESAITKVCPVNYFFGIDTRKQKSPVRKIKEALI